jgi:hypothetical protein
MEKKQMDDMMKELLVAGLKNYKWGSLSMPQLIMLLRIIGSMETVKAASTETNPVSGFRIANNQAGVS